MSVVRIIFLGTPDFAVAPLEALATDEHFEVVRVYTQPDKPAGRNLNLKPTPVKARALELGLDVRSVENINAPDILDEIRNLGVDSAVVVAFGQILSDEFLQIFPHPSVNVHSSLLPRWRGAAPMQRALLADDKETGVSLQIIVPKLDAGAVLGERRLVVTDDLDIVGLYDDLKKKSCELVTMEFMDYVRGHLTGQEQDTSKITIAKKIKKEEGLLNWQAPARECFNKVRALKGWPGTWTFREGKPLKILAAKVGIRANGKPGEVIRLDSDSFEVLCGDGTTLCVTSVQPESRAAMKVADYIRGYRLQMGEILGVS